MREKEGESAACPVREAGGKRGENKFAGGKDWHCSRIDNPSFLEHNSCETASGFRISADGFSCQGLRLAVYLSFIPRGARL